MRTRNEVFVPREPQSDRRLSAVERLSLEDAYSRYAPSAKRLAYLLLRDADAAEDMAQDPSSELLVTCATSETRICFGPTFAQPSSVWWHRGRVERALRAPGSRSTVLLLREPGRMRAWLIGT